MADPVADSTPTEPPAGTWPVNEEPTLNGHELTTTGVTDVEMKEDAPVPSVRTHIFFLRQPCSL